jgi:hypothetical protein
VVFCTVEKPATPDGQSKFYLIDPINLPKAMVLANEIRQLLGL